MYEEAINTVTTMRDFTQVFDAYAEFEESILTVRMQQHEAGGDDVDLDLRLARFEHLMDQRPFLVNDVMLRQNPHNVSECMKRVELYQGQNDKV